MLLSGSVLVVGGAESFQEWELGNNGRPKATSDLWDCISAKEIRLCSSVFMPTAGPLWPHLGYYGSVQSLYSAV